MRLMQRLYPKKICPFRVLKDSYRKQKAMQTSLNLTETMFTLKLYDRKGQELKIGDIVKISDGRRFTFFAEVKYLESENVITPFHTFTFHSVEKVDSVPPEAQKSTEDRYNIWFIDSYEEDEASKDFDRFLMSWRACEHNIDNRMWRIERA